jgi:hypothetical protein
MAAAACSQVGEAAVDDVGPSLRATDIVFQEVVEIPSLHERRDPLGDEDADHRFRGPHLDDDGRAAVDDQQDKTRRRKTNDRTRRRVDALESPLMRWSVGRDDASPGSIAGYGENVPMQHQCTMRATVAESPRDGLAHRL